MTSQLPPGALLRALRKKRTIYCVVCGTAHVVSDTKAQYCSNRCRQIAKRARTRKLV